MAPARVGLALALAALAGCTARANAQTATARSGYINAATGGNIRLDDGLTLSIPPHLLPHSATVTLSVTDHASTTVGPGPLQHPTPISPVVVVRFSPSEALPRSASGPQFQQARMTLSIPASYSAQASADRSHVHFEIGEICSANGTCLGVALNPEQQDSQTGVVVGLLRSFFLDPSGGVDHLEVYSIE